MAENTIVFKCIAGVVFVIIALLVIILPMSFATLEYYQYGFTKQKSTGKVSLDKVYSMGKHLIGPDYEFKVFPASSHYVELVSIPAFTQDNLEVRISASYQYFLRKRDLPLLHREFDLSYQSVVETKSIDAIKGATGPFTTRHMFENRSLVEDTLYEAVRQRLGGICCAEDCEAFPAGCPLDCLQPHECQDEDKGVYVDVKYFQLGAVSIPRDVKERLMRALTLMEDALKEELLQEAQLKRKSTQKDVQQIKNEAAELKQNAVTTSSTIKLVSQANYTVLIEKARSKGLKQLYTSLGIQTQEHKNSFDYLRTLRGLDNIHLTVDFQQRIAGSL